MKQISINGCTIGCEDISCASSSSSAGSIGSFSSGYGSQSTVVAKGDITNFDVKSSSSPRSPTTKSSKETPFVQTQATSQGTSVGAIKQLQTTSITNAPTTNWKISLANTSGSTLYNKAAVTTVAGTNFFQFFTCFIIRSCLIYYTSLVILQICV